MLSHRHAPWQCAIGIPGVANLVLTLGAEAMKRDLHLFDPWSVWDSAAPVREVYLTSLEKSHKTSIGAQ
jgi:hypothetical protein